MPPCHGGGRRFESVPGRQISSQSLDIFYLIYGFIAQLVEQGTENPRVSGSIPLEATKMEEIRLCISSFLFLGGYI